MSRLTRLMARPVKLILGDEEFDIYPMSMKNIPLMMAASSKNEEKQGEAFQKMMEITLRKAVPDATQEEIDGFSMKYFQELSQAIMKANGLEDAQVRKKDTEHKRKE